MPIPVQSPQYGPYNQTGPQFKNAFTAQPAPAGGPTPAPAAPGGAPAAPGGFDMNALLQAFVTLAQSQGANQMNRQNAQNAFDLRSEHDAQSGRHLGMSGVDVADEAAAGPFGTPIKFKSPQERYNEMAGMGLSPIGVPPRNDTTNPYFVGALGPGTPVATPPMPGKRKGASFGFGAGGSRGFNAGVGLM